MKQRKDGRWLKVITVDGRRINFYSRERNEDLAEKDIQKQLLNYKDHIYIDKHNFKILGEKMLEERGRLLEAATIECYEIAFSKLSSLYNMNIEEIRPEGEDEE